ncbi:MAG: hypothetical protein KDB74_01570 [Flavobacteriales bacterium]|nr:hypothetical protein [Flavobacteriales bacterium]
MTLKQAKYYYKRIYNRAIKDAREKAFMVEAMYAPRDDSKCCKCPTSHAKSDGAAIVVDILTELYKKD